MSENKIEIHFGRRCCDVVTQVSLTQGILFCMFNFVARFFTQKMYWTFQIACDGQLVSCFMSRSIDSLVTPCKSYGFKAQLLDLTKWSYSGGWFCTKQPLHGEQQQHIPRHTKPNRHLALHNFSISFMISWQLLSGNWTNWYFGKRKFNRILKPLGYSEYHFFFEISGIIKQAEFPSRFSVLL